jgi:predicted outer membrane protein
MVENHQQAMAALSRVTGAAFDRAYMQRQVAAHQYTLTNMDRLAPMTAAIRIPEQRALIEANRAMVAAHLQQAQQLAGSTGR